MKILISGGGIAGLTLAYWLHNYGFTPVVIEQADGIRHDGYGIDFFGTGYDVASRMGLIEQLHNQAIPIQFVSYVDSKGKNIAKLDIALMEKVMKGNYIALMHWTLEESLYETIKNDVEIRFGCSLKAVQQNNDAVIATFDDGVTESFDLLIGADGIHSNTRQLVFGPESQFGRYMGYYVACYPLPDRYGIGQTWRNYTEPKRQVGVYCSNNEGQIITLFMYAANDNGPIPPEQRLSCLRQTFDGMGWITPQLLNDVNDSTKIYMDTVTQIHMPSWHQGRVGLVGDASSCLTLISGQGASMAMGGAYLLAQALRDNLHYEDGFCQFEKRMRPEIETRQKNARDFAKAFVPGSNVELIVQKLVMKLILRDLFIGVLRKQFGSESILN
ncbi:MAG: FAD-dependent monooxygenase [Chloroflexota bacterium]